MDTGKNFFLHYMKYYICEKFRNEKFRSYEKKSFQVWQYR